MQASWNICYAVFSYFLFERLSFKIMVTHSLLISDSKNDTKGYQWPFMVNTENHDDAVHFDNLAIKILDE